MVWFLCLVAAPNGVSAQPQAPTGPLPPPDDYLIGVEDVLGVVVWGEPQLTLDVQVRPDGRITVPLLNDIDVVGRSPEEVGARIGEALETYIKDPNVTVIVREINSFRVYFLGEVASQGALQFLRPTRLLQGIAAAGGLTQFARKEITVLREESGIEKRIPIDYKKLLAGDPSQENLYLKPGDTVLVP